MKITDLFIRRPVIAIVVNVVIVIAGLQAISSLTVRQYPRNENSTVVITTAYVGANADLVRGFITTPIERAIAAADGVDYIESESRQNVSIIRARLELNQDANRALSEIGAKVDRVRGDLPPEAEVPVIDVESADSQFAAAYLSFSSGFLEQNEITDYLVRVVQPRLSAVPGVQRADILGGRTFAMRIWLDGDRMASLGVSPSEVRRALAANNYLSAVGSTRGSMIQVNLTANTNLTSAAEFEQLVVREQDDAIIRLRDVATVALGAESYDEQVAFSGETAVFIGIWALPNSNTLDVVAAVREELEAIRADLPEQLDARLAYDATAYIDSAIDEVASTLVETLLIVVLVIFLFLGSLRSVLVPLVAIPVSLIGAIFLMQMLGFTLNLLTLLAIVLAVGLVVDDAIVVVENVERWLREGKSRLEAARLGAAELVGPIVAMTITLAAVYAPIAFQGGLTGSLFREFALTLAGAVTISGIVALTLSPVMASRLLVEGAAERGLAGRINRGFDRIKAVYARWLAGSLKVRPAIYVAWVLLSLGSVILFVMSPKELAPTEDQGIVFGIVNTPSNATLEQITPSIERIQEIASSFPETDYVFQITTPAFGFWGMGLAPWDERERTASELVPAVQQLVQDVPGSRPSRSCRRRFRVAASSRSSSSSRRRRSTPRSSSTRPLRDEAAASGIFAFPPLIDVKIDQPETEIVIDRDRAAELGLDLQTIGQDLASAFGGNFVNRFSTFGRSYKVIPQIQRSERLNPDQLLDLRVTGPRGQLIPVSSFATLENRVTPRSLNRFEQLNSVKLSGVSIRTLDDALTFLETRSAEILPPSYSTSYTGESRQLRVEGDSFGPAFALAVVLIFLVLAAQFDSFRDPFVILAGSVPLAMFGALAFTFLKMPNPNMSYWTDGWTTTLNVYSQVGLVTLVGLVAKNGILIVEFANELQLRGQSKLEAIQNAATTRLRPVLMTTVATVFGHFPLVLVEGPAPRRATASGSCSWRAWPSARSSRSSSCLRSTCSSRSVARRRRRTREPRSRTRRGRRGLSACTDLQWNVAATGAGWEAASKRHAPTRALVGACRRAGSSRDEGAADLAKQREPVPWSGAFRALARRERVHGLQHALRREDDLEATFGGVGLGHGPAEHGRGASAPSSESSEKPRTCTLIS
ncbi:MAG: efflux RND transporter permease subunit [Sandaracinus sp.]|nr:efflux RND transporter permease subunit [Sandaracinus sp.]